MTQISQATASFAMDHILLQLRDAEPEDEAVEFIRLNTVKNDQGEIVQGRYEIEYCVERNGDTKHRCHTFTMMKPSACNALFIFASLPVNG
jgi:hypothetical protein